MTVFWFSTLLLIICACMFIFMPLWQTQKLKAAGLSIFITIFSYLCYNHWGASEYLPHYFSPEQIAKQQEILQVRPLLAELKKEVTRYQYRVQVDPKDVEAWWQLAQLFQIQKDFQQATSAMKAALELEPDNLTIKAHYVTLRARSREGFLDSVSKQLIAEILAQEPNQATALNLLAVDAYQVGDYKQAIEVWEKIISQLPANEKGLSTKQALNEMIKKAQERAVLPQVRVHIKLAADLINKVQPQDTLFISAKSIDGNPMPVAAIKLQAQDLPLTLSLGVHHAMMPEWTLANTQAVVIAARISKTEEALSKPGDLFGKTKPVLPHTSENNRDFSEILINSIIN